MAKYVGKTKKRRSRKGKPKIQMSASQKKEWDRYKREAKKMGLDAGPKPRRKGGNIVNEPDPLPEPPRDAHWIRYSDHPKEGTELRCMFCGAWYSNHRAGEFHGATWDDGVSRLRGLAEGAGNEGGGYRSRGPVLWAMRVLKTADFIASHYLYHQGATKDEWRELKPWENIGTPGKLKESNQLGNEWPHDPIWQRHPDLGVLVFDERDDVWFDAKDAGYRCTATWADTEAKCSAADVIRKAVETGELEDIPF